LIGVDKVQLSEKDIEVLKYLHEKGEALREDILSDLGIDRTVLRKLRAKELVYVTPATRTRLWYSLTYFGKEAINR
jgi:DNA-binding MarR family transcriptional regulator